MPLVSGAQRAVSAIVPETSESVTRA